MSTIRISDVLPDQVLVSRESARVLEQSVRVALAGLLESGGASETTALSLDFAGVGGVAPSFLDELISVLEAVIAGPNCRAQITIKVLNPPTRLSTKFEAVARGHSLRASAMPDGSWLLSQ